MWPKIMRKLNHVPSNWGKYEYINAAENHVRRFTQDFVKHAIDVLVKHDWTVEYAGNALYNVVEPSGKGDTVGELLLCSLAAKEEL